MKKIKLQAFLDDVNVLTVLVEHSLYKNDQQLSIYHHKKHVNFYKILEEKKDDFYKLVLKVNQKINLRDDWKITLDEAIESEIISGKVVRTQSFIDEYNYQDDDLGVSYNEKYSTFKLWAPLAKKIHLLLESPSGHKERYDLSYEKQGTWKVKVDKDLEKYTYIYNVYVNGKWRKVKDPYAIASKANGDIQYIIDSKKTYNIKHTYHNPDTPFIYEVSVRDFSSNKESNFKNPKKYLGLIETGLKTPNGHPIGFDYVKELGITHLQMLPIFDFTGVDELNQNEKYNWGYNPSQYFIPEGSYASHPNHPYTRINEIKKVIDTYHQNDLGMIMDVVYNHVDHHDKFPYEILTPGYSFRYDEFGMMTDFSGCKNDLDTSRPMIKKLIIDSLLHWLKFYKVDGFRFDLMGLIDYNTMNELYLTLKKIKPDILVYGEGWKIDNNETLAHMDNSKLDDHIGFFNDEFRDSVKGSTFITKDTGLVFGNLDYKNVVDHLLNSKGKIKVEKSINFVECHDNQTFFDKAMTIIKDENLVHKYQIVANCLTVFAPGTPFIHFGQEIYRSKSFEHNSYNLSDEINQVKWHTLDLYKDDVFILKSAIEIRKKMNPYHIRKTKWIKSTLVLFVGQFEIYFKFDDDNLTIKKEKYLYIHSSKYNKIKEAYILKDIGVYIFERK
ncbi:type I pullulanase [Mycoplasmatota bacterium]|nr:type I pullulanase [Mycoplasmatota bacterium]